MKHLILSILAFNTFAIPIINRPEHVPVQDTVHEVLFWCDCGVSIHWKDLPLMEM